MTIDWNLAECRYEACPVKPESGREVYQDRFLHHPLAVHVVRLDAPPPQELAASANHGAQARRRDRV